MKKYLILILLTLLLTACSSENKIEKVEKTIESNKMGQSELVNDITKKTEPTETKKENLENNVKIDGNIDLSKKMTNENTATPFPQIVETGELQIEDLTVGTGKTAQNGNMLTVHYQGWLVDGTMFDSSVKRGKPFQFELGLGRVIQGWDQGMLAMKEGGKRRLIIPSELGYGQVGAGELIPPGATLVFEVELLKVE